VVSIDTTLISYWLLQKEYKSFCLAWRDDFKNGAVPIS